MGLGKTYSADYLIDSNGNSGSANQVLISTSSGIDWVDGSGSSIIGGPYLPLAGGTMTGNTIHNDNAKSIYGTAGDGLQIFHNGIDSYILDSGTGDLYVEASTNFFVRNSDNGEVWIKATDNGVSLRFQDSQKLITTNTGITITGNFDGAANMFLQDYIYHSGDGNTFFGFNGADDFRIYAGNTLKMIADADNVRLYYNGAQKFETTTSGVTVTGKISGLTAGTANTDAVNVQQLNDATTGALIFIGTWAAGTTGVTNAAISTTTITLTAAPANAIAVGDIVTADGITAVIKVTAIGTTTSVTVDAAVTIATGITVTFSPAGGYPDLTQASLKITGNYYICETAGVATPNGTGTTPNEWAVGDWVAFSDLTTDAWQKIDNSSVLSGAGTGGSLAAWSGSGTSVTLQNAPATFSGNDTTFAGAGTFAGNVGIGGSPSHTLDVKGADTNNATIARFYSNTATRGSFIIKNGFNVSPTTFIGTAGGSEQLSIGTNSTEAIRIDGSQNSIFAGTVTALGGGGGYDSIMIATNLAANTNKQSGITTENYEGNSVSIFQTFTQNNNNTVYYGSADASHSGIQKHSFYVNADSNTPGSGHTEAFAIASNTNATFAGDVLVEDNLYLTDAGTTRAKIQLNSSDRDNLDIKAVSLGSTMNFFTADTLALGLDASQNATFSGDVMPSGENLHDIGSAAVRWENIYADQVYGREVYVDTKIIHNGDADTFLSFSDDTITLSAGGASTTLAGNGSATFPGTINSGAITSTGNITTARAGTHPEFALNVTGIANTTNATIRLGIIGIDNGGLSIRDVTNSRDWIRAHPTGAISMPSGALSVTGNVTTGPNISATGNTGNSTLTLQANTGNWVFTNVQNNRNLEISDSDGTGVALTIDTSGKVGIGTTSPAAKLDVVGNIKSPTNSLSTAAAPTSFGVYTSDVRLIDTPNGGLKKCRVITDTYGEWILVGRFAADARTTVQSTWSSVSGLSLGTAQNETTQFSADFGDSFPEEVRIMGATDFTSWRDTRTVDFAYKVPEGRKWKFFFSGGEVNGMVLSSKFGWNINGAYDGFGRWVNTAQNFVRMSDVQVDNPSAAYTTATTNAFNWNQGGDAKITVSATRVFSGQDTFVTSGFGQDDSVSGFFDEYPNETNNMQGGNDFSSAVWVLIKLPEGASGSGGSGANYWAADGNNISSTNSGNVGIGTNIPAEKLHVNGEVRVDGNDGVATKKIRSSYFSSSQNLDLQTGSSADIILTTRNVGIGTTAPTTAKLVVAGNANIYTARLDASTTTGQSYGMRIRGGTNSTDTSFLVENTSAASYFQVRGDGNVGIAANPTQKLHVAGNARVTGAFYDSNNSPGTLSGTELDKQLSIKLNEDGAVVGTKWKEIVFTPDIWEVNNGIFTSATTLVCDTVRAYNGNTNTTGSGASAGEIRIVDPGVYEITYSVAIQVGSTSITVRQNPALYLTSHTVGGTEASIPGSVNSVYLRLPNNNQGGRTSFANTCYHEVPANTDIALKLDWLNGAQSVEIYKAFGIENTISIRKISDTQTGGE